jgi:hypothetical protein
MYHVMTHECRPQTYETRRQAEAAACALVRQLRLGGTVELWKGDPAGAGHRVERWTKNGNQVRRGR